MPGEYFINISGENLEEGAFEKLITQLKPRLEIFSPGYEINIYSFAGIKHRLEITGVPKRFDFVDNLIKSMKVYMGKYTGKWEYDIIVKFIESG